MSFYSYKNANPGCCPGTIEGSALSANYALVIDGAIQFNGLVADYASLGLEGYDAGMDAVSTA